MPEPFDEFAWIASLRGLALGDERALSLADDAAVLPARPGFDLVISKDAMVEGIHFPVGEAPATIARRLLRTSLSDLAAKAATPFGYFLMTAFPPGLDANWRSGFAGGLEEDGRAFGVALLGGDTVSTSGPLVVSATVLGWVPQGRAVLRSGARAGDAVMVCGPIGDGLLGLQALRRGAGDPTGALVAHFRLPVPLLAIRDALAAHAHAAADVSDGLIADAGHVADASNLGFRVELDALPLSRAGRAWLMEQSDASAGRLSLATGGDDYAIVCAVAPEEIEAFARDVTAAGVCVARLGQFHRERVVTITASGRPVDVTYKGWRHGVEG